jgi:8-oxo-dGTP diphosphatase
METTERYRDHHFCQRCGHPLTIEPDREEKVRPRCSSCGWIYYANPVPASACVVLNEQNELLLVKRKFEPYPGEWALPSGYIEIDQTPDACAIAELHEETGLIGEIERFLDYYSGPSPVYENVISFAFVMKVMGGRLQAGDDAAEACYVPITGLPRLCFNSHRHFVELLRQQLSL